ncbi:hypothetical protein, unlikely [Trypanosoma brucei brucei TREU927]|uniref:Uncharacterized protein n=1 Tax=Trypanosoma brucei brucei (strain 927/4 GUTat10.1) TaxID=185431 RepID=Q4GYN9_TRYB2|nr:hypothetical protein, unlikely [Trypanosoma brucei brucei TREU927]CAJ16545.1 hypothetical protein, unlikely [Trypanosoma brucei brucei TREU927]
MNHDCHPTASHKPVCAGAHSRSHTSLSYHIVPNSYRQQKGTPRKLFFPPPPPPPTEGLTSFL